MNRRIELHAILCEILGCPERGKECRAYFQPPATIKMQYDCVRYERTKIDQNHADNLPYLLHDRYQLTLIYKNPDSDLPKKISALPMCSHERHYTADNLNHDVFNLYF
jgi:hypothetical protein